MLISEQTFSTHQMNYIKYYVQLYPLTKDAEVDWIIKYAKWFRQEFPCQALVRHRNED